MDCHIMGSLQVLVGTSASRPQSWSPTVHHFRRIGKNIYLIQPHSSALHTHFWSRLVIFRFHSNTSLDHLPITLPNIEFPHLFSHDVFFPHLNNYIFFISTYITIWKLIRRLDDCEVYYDRFSCLFPKFSSHHCKNLYIGPLSSRKSISDQFAYRWGHQISDCFGSRAKSAVPLDDWLTRSSRKPSAIGGGRVRFFPRPRSDSSTVAGFFRCSRIMRWSFVR